MTGLNLTNNKKLPDSRFKAQIFQAYTFDLCLVSTFRVTAIDLSDLVPSPLREMVRMRGIIKSIFPFLFPSPRPYKYRVLKKVRRDIELR